jgi:hypothetical protein
MEMITLKNNSTFERMTKEQVFKFLSIRIQGILILSAVLIIKLLPTKHIYKGRDLPKQRIFVHNDVIDVIMKSIATGVPVRKFTAHIHKKLIASL